MYRTCDLLVCVERDVSLFVPHNSVHCLHVLLVPGVYPLSPRECLRRFPVSRPGEVPPQGLDVLGRQQRVDLQRGRLVSHVAEGVFQAADGQSGEHRGSGVAGGPCDVGQQKRESPQQSQVSHLSVYLSRGWAPSAVVVVLLSSGPLSISSLALSLSPLLTLQSYEVRSGTKCH